MEREFRHQQQREAHYAALKLKDPFEAARFLEKMERKRLQPEHEAAARAEKKARKEQQRSERERGKREREVRKASNSASSSGTKKRREESKEPDMVAFKANLSGAVSTALKVMGFADRGFSRRSRVWVCLRRFVTDSFDGQPFFIANKIADKESFKHLCRKLTKTLVKKESERGNTGKWHPKLGSAAAKFVESFMGKLEARGQV